MSAAPSQKNLGGAGGKSPQGSNGTFVRRLSKISKGNNKSPQNSKAEKTLKSHRSGKSHFTTKTGKSKVSRLSRQSTKSGKKPKNEYISPLGETRQRYTDKFDDEEDDQDPENLKIFGRVRKCPPIITRHGREVPLQHGQIAVKLQKVDEPEKLAIGINKFLYQREIPMINFNTEAEQL